MMHSAALKQELRSQGDKQPKYTRGRTAYNTDDVLFHVYSLYIETPGASRRIHPALSKDGWLLNSHK